MTAPAHLRPATPADLDAVVAFHVALWRETYRGVAPDAAFEALDEAKRRPGWAERLAAPRQGAILAEAAGAVVGFAAYGDAADPAFGAAGEVKHLYVDGARRREGLGRRLLQAAFDRLGDLGHARAGLAVVEENRAAAAFYRALGGREAGRFTDAGPLWRSRNIVFDWPIDGAAGLAPAAKGPRIIRVDLAAAPCIDAGDASRGAT